MTQNSDNNSNEFLENDDESDWEPILVNQNESSTRSRNTGVPRLTSSKRQNAGAVSRDENGAATWQSLSSSLQRTTSSNATSTRQQQESSSDGQQRYRQERMRTIQRKLETKSRLKEGFVSHPMRLLWSQFLVHFGRELWELDLQIRLALLLIVVGAMTKILLLSTWYLWYPKLLFAAILVVVSYVYLNPNFFETSLNSVGRALGSPTALADALSQLDPTQLRRLFLAFLLIPTLLEMRTIHFLSQIKAESGWTLYNMAISFFILAVMSYLYSRRGSSPRECAHIGLVLLYGSALLVTLARIDLWRLPILVAPFFLATGVLVLSSHQNNDPEWFSRAVRHALRLTLRDVLGSVGKSVQEDEMLQLAMLRWIVDYWSNSPTTTATDGGGNNSTTTTTDASAGLRRPSGRSSSTSSLIVPYGRELEWNELVSMLSMTTDQMASEVQALQAPTPTTATNENDNSTSSTLVTSSASSLASSPAAHSTSSLRPSTQSTTSSSRPSMHSTTTNSSTSPGSDSVQNLQSMLASMDLDERAKPAVEAYKRGVKDFPPSRTVSIVFSVARRCPALLTLLWQIFFNVSGSLSSTAILIPFIIFEVIRIKQWSEACKRAASNDQATNERDEASFLGNVDPMVILLSDDRLSMYRPPTLLSVWMNVCSSVSALEVGLTAARCVQTTAVAVDFAGNMLSLAQFGVEVSQFGWLHGLAVLAKELIVLHSNARVDERVRSQSTRYTTAAVSAVHNSRKMTHNVRVLMEEENTGQLINPLLGVLTVIIGRGWLWGQEEGPRRVTNTSSTVEIVELDESSNEVLQNDPSETVDIVEVQKRNSDNMQTEPRERNVNNADIFDISLRDSLVADHDAKPSARPAGIKNDLAQDNHMGELSEIMDLVAACAENNLIDKSEKNEICEKLSLVRSDNEWDVAWMKGTKETLKGLLCHSNSAAETEPDTPAKRAPTNSQCVASEAENQPSEQSPPGGMKGSSPLSKEGAGLNNGCARLDSVEPVEKEANEPRRPGESSSEASSHDGHCASETNTLLPIISKRETIAVIENDDDFVPLEPERVAVATTRTGTTDSSTALIERKDAADVREDNSSTEESQQDGGDNAWMIGGLAALGVVAGGIAIAMHGNDDDKRSNERRRERHNNSSRSQ